MVEGHTLNVSSEPVTADESAIEPPEPATPLHTQLARLIIDHNPFFLLSGACMLLGCFLINSAAHQHEDRLDLIVALLVIFNVYEMLVIGLGLYLGTARGLVRDAAYLLLLEVLLISDLTFLYTEVFTASASVGAAAAVLGFGLALGKLAVIFHFLNIRCHIRDWSVFILTFLTLFAMPGVLRQFGEADAVTPMVLHIGWWWAGGLLAIMTWPRRDAIYGRNVNLVRLAYALRIGVGLLPWLSIVAHLQSAHYVYQVEVVPAHYAPLLLGLAILMVRWHLKWGTRYAARTAIVTACLGAIALTLTDTPALLVEVNWPTAWMLSPMRAVIAAAVLIAIAGFIRLRGVILPAFAVLGLYALWLGHDVEAMKVTLHQHTTAVGNFLSDMAPRTTLHWGILGVVAAFVLLVVGTVLSLRKPAAGESVEE